MIPHDFADLDAFDLMKIAAVLVGLGIAGLAAFLWIARVMVGG